MKKNEPMGAVMAASPLPSSVWAVGAFLQGIQVGGARPLRMTPLLYLCPGGLLGARRWIIIAASQVVASGFLAEG